MGFEEQFGEFLVEFGFGQVGDLGVLVVGGVCVIVRYLQGVGDVEEYWVFELFYDVEVEYVDYQVVVIEGGVVFVEDQVVVIGFFVFGQDVFYFLGCEELGFFDIDYCVGFGYCYYQVGLL